MILLLVFSLIPHRFNNNQLDHDNYTTGFKVDSKTEEENVLFDRSKPDSRCLTFLASHAPSVWDQFSSGIKAGSHTHVRTEEKKMWHDVFHCTVIFQMPQQHAETFDTLYATYVCDHKKWPMITFPFTSKLTEIKYLF